MNMTSVVVMLTIFMQTALVFGGGVADDTVRARGIYVDGANPPASGAPRNSRIGVKFNVKLNRNGEERLVPSNYEFRDGDRMRFQFEVNRASYVYVLHTTVSGSPNSVAARGIDVVRDRQADYQLLFPRAGAGQDSKLEANRPYTIPSSDVTFVMDSNPGVEKIFVVVSSASVDMTKYFNLENGRLREDGDPVVQLVRDLSSWNQNAEVALPDAGVRSRGIEMDGGNTHGYGLARATSKPMTIQVNLNHHPLRTQ